MALRDVTAKVITETTIQFQASTGEEADSEARRIITEERPAPDIISVEIISVERID